MNKMNVFSKPPPPPPTGHKGNYLSKVKSAASKAKSLSKSNVGFSGLNSKMVNSQYNKLKNSLNKYGGKKSRKNNRKFSKKNKLRKTYKRRKTNKRKPKKISKRKKNLTRRKRRGGTLKDLVNLENLQANPGSTADAIQKFKKNKEKTKNQHDAMFDTNQTKGLFNPLIKSKPTNN